MTSPQKFPVRKCTDIFDFSKACRGRRSYCRRNLPYFSKASRLSNQFRLCSFYLISSFSMSTPLDGPNPLRPYYIPPSIAQPPGVNISTSSPPFTGSKHVPAPKPSFGSSARDILSDLDYSGYLSDSSPSTPEVIKGLVDQALWKYTSVLLAQPFEVAKTVLQVQLASSVQDGSSQTIIAEDMRRNPSSYRDEIYDVRSRPAFAYNKTNIYSRSLRTSLTQTLHPISHLLLRSHILPLDLQSHIVADQELSPPHQPLKDIRRIPSASYLRLPLPLSYLISGQQKALGVFGKAPIVPLFILFFYQH